MIDDALRRRAQPHHLRRRFLALAALAGLLLLIGVLIGSGGATSHRAAAQPPGYFARIDVLGGIGPGSFVAEQKGEEADAINRTLAYAPYVRVAGSQHREIALTFDDGPGPYTPQIVSILESTDVPATFFEVGVEERYFHDSTSRIAALGYPIGDHTEGHVPMSGLSARDQRDQLLKAASAIGQYGAPFPRLFRPPFGLWSATTLRLLHSLRMLMVLWTVDTADYRRPGTEAIVHSAVMGARPGAIILLHDAGGDRSQTVAALPRIIAALRAQGYRFVTVPRLLLDNPPGRDQQFTSAIGSGG